MHSPKNKMEAAPSLVDATADGDALLLLADGAHLRAHLLLLRKASPRIERMAGAPPPPPSPPLPLPLRLRAAAISQPHA